MKELDKLSIPEQVILFNHFNLLDGVALKAFKISESDLYTIKELAKERFAPKTVSINPNLYADQIEEINESHEQPRSSTRKRRPRGRPGLNIIKAFASIPYTPVPAVQFAKEHKISINSLRQHTRFDNIGMSGKVVVKQDKDTKELMVVRKLN